MSLPKPLSIPKELAYPVDLPSVGEWKSFTPGLERVQSVLNHLGDPHKAYPHILVGGTNGKGSLVWNLGHQVEGRIGAFLSPHLCDIRERITISGDFIPDVVWQVAQSRIKTVLNGTRLSFFEWLFLIAVLVFEMEKVDLAVFEVGMGGRLDATNALDPFLSVLTSVGLDHMNYLGTDIVQIAQEKIPIARKDKIFILPSEVFELETVEETLKQLETKTTPIDLKQETPQRCGQVLLDAVFSYSPGLKRKQSAVWRTLPGRKQVLSGANGRKVYLDGAHNLPAWESTITWLQQEGIKSINMILGLTEPRNPDILCSLLSPYSKKIFSWAEPHSLYVPLDRWPKKVKPIEVGQWQSLLDEDLLVCGSLYLVGSFLRWYRHK